MFSKNNRKQYELKTANGQQHFSLRKTTLGLASVLLSTTLYLGGSNSLVQAASDTATNTESQTATSQSIENNNEEKVDKSQLQSAYDNALNVQKSDKYTNETDASKKSAFDSAVANAKKVLDNASATSEDVKNTISNLESAASQLTGTSQTNEAVNTTETKTSTNDTDTSAAMTTTTLNVSSLSKNSILSNNALTTSLVADTSNQTVKATNPGYSGSYDLGNIHIEDLPNFKISFTQDNYNGNTGWQVIYNQDGTINAVVYRYEIGKVTSLNSSDLAKQIVLYDPKTQYQYTIDSKLNAHQDGRDGAQRCVQNSNSRQYTNFMDVLLYKPDRNEYWGLQPVDIVTKNSNNTYGSLKLDDYTKYAESATSDTKCEPITLDGKNIVNNSYAENYIILSTNNGTYVVNYLKDDAFKYMIPLYYVGVDTIAPTVNKDDAVSKVGGTTKSSIVYVNSKDALDPNKVISATDNGTPDADLIKTIELKGEDGSDITNISDIKNEVAYTVTYTVTDKAGNSSSFTLDKKYVVGTKVAPIVNSDTITVKKGDQLTGDSVAQMVYSNYATLKDQQQSFNFQFTDGGSTEKAGQYKGQISTGGITTDLTINVDDPELDQAKKDALHAIDQMKNLNDAQKQAAINAVNNATIASEAKTAQTNAETTNNNMGSLKSDDNLTNPIDENSSTFQNADKTAQDNYKKALSDAQQLTDISKGTSEGASSDPQHV